MKTPLLEVRQVSLKREGKFLLKDINFTLNSMEILSIIGAKGAGKGLLLKTLLGIQKGEMTGTIKNHAGGCIGLVSNVYSCIDQFTVFQNLSLISKFMGVSFQAYLGEEIEEVLKAVGLWSELKSQLHQRVESLSAYQKLRLNVARSLLFKPCILLLERPTPDLDPEKKAHFESIIEDLKSRMSIIWVNHDLEQTARVSDQVLFLKDGAMIECAPCEDIFTRPSAVETENFISRRVNV